MEKQSYQNLLDCIENLLSADQENWWQIYKKYMVSIGLDTLLYAYVDTINHELETAPFLFKSTVQNAWFEHYYKNNYHLLDHVLVLRKKGVRAPITLGSEMAPPEPFRNNPTIDMLSESGEAGFKSCVNYQLPDYVGRNNDDIFAMTIGTSESPTELYKILGAHRKEINIITALLHNQFCQNLSKTAFKPLTRRERECLAWSSKGYRVDRIADKLTISNASVNFHLKNARTKLKAKTLPEATAIATRLKLLTL